MAKYLTDTALRLEIESIFEDAIELAPAERGRWLADRCGTDHRLRSEVDALIAAHESAERVGLLEKSVAAAATAALKDVQRGRRIGAYRVLRELDRGGTGVVFLAERDDGQYEQRVAVKLLQAGPDNETLHRRFLAERQILVLHAVTLRLLDKNDSAEAELREAIAVDRAAAGPQSLDAAGLQLRLAEVVLQARGALGTLSDILMERGRFDEAIAACQREIDIRRRIFGAESSIQGLDMARLARVYARKRDFPAADSLFRAALANQRRYVSDTHFDVRAIYGFMSERYRLERKPVEAERYARMAQGH